MRLSCFTRGPQRAAPNRLTIKSNRRLTGWPGATNAGHPTPDASPPREAHSPGNQSLRPKDGPPCGPVPPPRTGGTITAL